MYYGAAFYIGACCVLLLTAAAVLSRVVCGVSQVEVSGWPSIIHCPPWHGRLCPSTGNKLCQPAQLNPALPNPCPRLLPSFPQSAKSSLHEIFFSFSRQSRPPLELLFAEVQINLAGITADNNSSTNVTFSARKVFARVFYLPNVCEG